MTDRAYWWDVIVFDGRYWGRAGASGPGIRTRQSRDPFACPFLAAIWAIKRVRKYMKADANA